MTETVTDAAPFPPPTAQGGPTGSKLVRDRVGEIRPSQLMFTYGIGAVVDLQHLSAIVLSLDDWDVLRTGIITEDRLLRAIQAQPNLTSVATLRTPPAPPEGSDGAAFGEQYIGVPIAAFPRWLLCPFCRLLAPINSGLFQLKIPPYRPEGASYVHTNCSKGVPGGRGPMTIPVRFVVACANGHIDDFPWVDFVHKAGPCPAGNPLLRLNEVGATGEAVAVAVKCDACNTTRRMSDAFSTNESKFTCSARSPHLRRYDDDECDEAAKPILLGASNIWFPRVLAALSIPQTASTLDNLVVHHLHRFEKVTSADILGVVRSSLGPAVADLASYEDDEVWAAVLRLREGQLDQGESESLKVPEWRAFTHPDATPGSPDFTLREVPIPDDFSGTLSRIVLVERLREVRAFVGFTRIQGVNDFGDATGVDEQRPLVSLTRRETTWVPATDMRGEGLFLQFDEAALAAWEARLADHDRHLAFQDARSAWRAGFNSSPESGTDNDPGLLRRVLLHSFSHALMRQLALNSGYAMASLTERIYALPPTDPDGPMAGILIYTAATDSEGTLGGLVRLGEGVQLADLLSAALASVELCASDPLCSEHEPEGDTDIELHGAACHACLFAPETSCEMGNRWLDRATLAETFAQNGMSFFPDA